MKSLLQKRAETQPISTVINVAELPKDVQDYLQKFRVWEESFHHTARREKYIQQVSERIVARYNPEKIILFG